MELPILWPGFTYKPHQKEGVKWLLEREKKTPSGGIVCDEMGLGKTIQLLALLKTEQKTRTLLIAPVAVLSLWDHRAAANKGALPPRVENPGVLPPSCSENLPYRLRDGPHFPAVLEHCRVDAPYL